ncbi:MAG TPA: hypothetical protein VGQ83_36695 [Polyangia bacterium]
MPTSAPAPAASAPGLFVGRRAELDRFVAAAEEVRLALVYGVAGMGKTSFMLRAASGLAAQRGGHLCHHACREGDSAASIAAETLAQLHVADGVPRRVRDPLEALARAALARPIVLCLDDAHRLGDPGVIDAAVHFAARRLPLWICVASREALAISPTRVDHVVIRLAALSAEEARALWRALEGVFGAPAAGVDPDEAVRGGTTPLMLKQTFAGSLGTGADPLGLRDLAPLERAVLAELCAYRRPVPAAALLHGRDPTLTRPAIQHLRRRFLVEAAAGELLAAHDLVRDLAARAGGGPAAGEHARCLAYYREVAASARAPASELEILYHAVHAAADDLAVALLERHAAAAAWGAPGTAVVEQELASAIDALAQRRELPVTLRLLRARIRARQGDMAEAFQEIRGLAGGGSSVDLDRGLLAYALGDPEEAIPCLRRALADTALVPELRVWGLVALVDAHRCRGDLPAAAAALARQGGFLDYAGPLGQGVRAAVRVLLAYFGERYADAAGQLLTARQRLAAFTHTTDRFPWLASLGRAIAAAQGLGDGDAAGASELFDEILFFRQVARLFRAHELLMRGGAAAAAELAGAAAQGAAERHFRQVEWSALAVWADALRLLGRSNEVVARLEPVLATVGPGWARLRLQRALAPALLARGETARARAVASAALASGSCAAGTAARLRALLGLADAVEAPAGAGARSARRGRAEGFDEADARLTATEALLWEGRLEAARAQAGEVAAAAGRAGWRHLAVRARLVAAEAVFRLGDHAAAQRECDAAARDCAEEGYLAEVLWAALLEAGLARARGDRERSAALLAETRERAAAVGLALEEEAARTALGVLQGGAPATSPAGARLARRFGLDAPPTVEVRLPAAVRRLSPHQLEELDLRGCALVVDLARGRVRVGRRNLDLARQQTSARILGVLAGEPGALVPLGALVPAVWAEEYHPLHHASRVTVAMTRLRQLVGRDLIEAGGDSYRLVVAGAWAVIRAAPARAGGAD